MNVLKRCCFRSMKENPKRTIVTLVGVILATALITGVACLAVSFRHSMIEYKKQQNGDYHYAFLGVKAENLKYLTNNTYVERVGLAEDIGYAVLEGSENPDKPFLFVRAVDKAGVEALALKLTEGRMPENDSEIVIGRHIRYNGMVDLRVGDVLSLDICRRVSDGCELNQQNPYTYEEESLEPLYHKTYTIVGVVERPNYVAEIRMAPGYSVFTYLDGDEFTGKLDVYANFTDAGLRYAEKVIAGILGVPEEVCRRYLRSRGLYCTEEEMQRIYLTADDVTENYWVLQWVQFSFSESTMNMIYSMAAMAILVIIVTSVFCIRNSFMISLTEKIKLYGRFASVGTTKKQQRKIIYYEAGFLGVVGIPVGILSGVLATYILVQVVGGLMEDALGLYLIFGVSVPAVIAAALLAAVTIRFSAAKAARQAAKVSPVSAIRGNSMVKAGRRGLRCPWFVGRLFGIGGRVAYKNLKRAKLKYRTTVISIVVSVAVFIGLTTFMQLMGVAAGVYYGDNPVQIEVELRGSAAHEGALKIAGLDGITAIEIKRSATVLADSAQVPYTEGYLKRYGETAEEEPIIVMALGESGYAAFCREVGVSAEEAGDKAIVVAEYKGNYFDKTLNKIVDFSETIARYRRGDVIEAKSWPAEGAGDGASEDDGVFAANIRMEVLTQTEKKPMYLQRNYYNEIILIVSDKWFEQQTAEGRLYPVEYVDLAIQCKDAGATEEDIHIVLQTDIYHYHVANYDAMYKSDRALYLIISIFLYGFVTVVTLIGITNIFNTITTNMEMRAPEFAMLRSVGMTGREFKRMIWLEGVFYGGKALIIGIPFGILLSLGFHRAFGEGIITDFVMPWRGIAISAAAVVVLLYVIMRYSMGKIRHRNIVETIQNENI